MYGRRGRLSRGWLLLYFVRETGRAKDTGEALPVSLILEPIAFSVVPNGQLGKALEHFVHRLAGGCQVP